MENITLTAEQMEIAEEIAAFAKIRGFNPDTMTPESFQDLLDDWMRHLETFYRKAANTPTAVLMEMMGFKPHGPKMTFEQILASEHREIVEALEWGCSDPEIEEKLKKELFQKTGWIWK